MWVSGNLLPLGPSLRFVFPWLLVMPLYSRGPSLISPSRTSSSPPPSHCPLQRTQKQLNWPRTSKYSKQITCQPALLSTASLEYIFGIFHYYSTTWCRLLTERPVVRLCWPFMLNSNMLIFWDFKVCFVLLDFFLILWYFSFRVLCFLVHNFFLFN